MRSTRARTKADQKTEQNLNSPIHRLPDELVAHVFILGCPKPDFNTSYTDRVDDLADPLPHQVLVSSICRLWRRISLQSPTLWSFIFIKLPFKNRSMAKRYGPLMDTIITRSGGAHVTFTLKQRSIQYGNAYGSPAFKTQLMDLLARAQYLKINTQAPILTPPIIPILPITRARYPHLQNLSLKLLPIASPPSLAIMGADPLDLRDLAYIKYGHWTPGYEISHFAQANPLHLFCEFNEVRNAFVTEVGKLGRIQRLEVSTSLWTASRPYSSPTVECLSLSVNMFPNEYSNSKPHVLPLLGDLPALVHLTLSITKRPWRDPHHYDEFMPRKVTLPELRTLAIIEKPLPGATSPQLQVQRKDTRNLLQRTPNLVALELWDNSAFTVLDDLCGDTEDGSGVRMVLTRLELLRVVINERTLLVEPDYYAYQVAFRCAKLKEERPSLRVEWWIICDRDDKEHLGGQGFLATAPVNVSRHLCDWRDAPPSLRLTFSPLMPARLHS